METVNVKQRFMELRAKGYSYDKIAKELKKAKQTLIDWSIELQEEIANLKAMELEELYSKYFLLKENRLQTFGELLDKMKKEVTNRDLSEVPTGKLLELLIKYSGYINDEMIEPEYLSSRKMQSEKLSRELLERF
jgi:replicative superfamily II helicase